MEPGAPAGPRAARFTAPAPPPATAADLSPAHSSRFLHILLVVLQAGVAAVSVVSILQWLGAMGSRLTNPYPVEWLEGAFVAHSLRVLHGQPIYIAPSAEFIPNLYPPLAYWVQALAMQWIGPTLPAARWVSVLATVGVAYLAALVVYRASRSRLAALAVGAIFLDAYAVCGGWYDQARNDMIFLFLGLASLIVVTGKPSIQRAIVAAILASLATWTRQQGLAFLALGLIHLGFRARKETLVFAVTAAAINIPGIYIAQVLSHGWFLRYTWTTLGDYTLHYDRMPIIFRMFVANLSLLFAATVLWLVIKVRLRRFGELLSVWGLGLGMFSLAAFLAMIKEGGFVNHFIPVVLFALILVGIAIGDFAHQRRHLRALAFALAILIVQYFAWPHPSSALVPGAVRNSQHEVVEEIRSHEGPVLALDDPYYLKLAGKAMHADGGTIFWLSEMDLDLPGDLKEKVSRQDYQAVLLSTPVEYGIHARTSSARKLYELIDEHYEFSRRIIPENGRVVTLRVPRYLYLPRPVGYPGDPLASR